MMASDERSTRALSKAYSLMAAWCEKVRKAFSHVEKALGDANIKIKIKQSRDPRIKKYYSIYRRSKKSRIKKKQMSKIKKLL